ncbi:MAG: spore coat protein [Desulfitobacteriaceae bacterium]|nr:spore coat protein [Desulfitobacteriaceae bacterium]MDD4401458.1 spore coat protein [Desulfitobacteriaceae bacterium]
MAHQLTQKEQLLLEDQKKHEEVCIQKYQDYATQVQDQQLKELLNTYAQQEQAHLNSVNEMLVGQVPSMGQGQQNQQQQQQQQQFSPTTAANAQSGGAANQQDAQLLNDLLMTEKYVSSAYDTAIFEFTNPQMRQALNHIQKEEQQHGEGIFNYMNAHGMYNPQ